MSNSELFKKGMEIRRAVVGAEYVDERAERARYVRLTLTPRKGGTENLDRPKVAEVMIFGKPVNTRKAGR